MWKWRTDGVTLLAILSVTFGLANALAGDQGFDAVAIHEIPRNAPILMRDPNVSSIRPGGQFVDPRTTLSSMIIFAFSIPSYYQLKGLPGWAQDQAFSVVAKPPEGLPELPPDKNREQVRGMMRDMLTSRFHLKLHSEEREDRIFKLEVDRGGVKVKAVDPPVAPEKEGFVNIAAGDAGGRMIGTKVTTAGIAVALTVMLKRPVLDKTGLKQFYTFNVKWTAPEQADGVAVKPGIGDTGVSELISAVKDLLGFRVTSGMGPVKYWEVDNVEHPTAN